MSNNILEKITIKERQEGKCAISGKPLPEDPELFDLQREPELRAVIPEARMKDQDTWRDREHDYEVIKGLIENRECVMRNRVKDENALLAHARGTDRLLPQTREWYETRLQNAKDTENGLIKEIQKEIRKAAKTDPFVAAVLGIRSVAELTVAYCITYIDVTRGAHLSCLWAYAGLHCPSHERYQKGTRGGGCKPLRTALWRMADSQIKGRGPYRYVYDDAKHQKENSEKLVKTRLKNGQLVEKPWKDVAPNHRHLHAMRMVMKYFLADYWVVRRQMLGIPTDGALYATTVLGHKNHHVTWPRERGWEWTPKEG